MVNHAACLKRLFGSEGQLTLLPWREFPVPGEIGFRIGVIVLGTIPVVLVIAAVFGSEPPDPETQSTANLLSAAMGQD